MRIKTTLFLLLLLCFTSAVKAAVPLESTSDIPTPYINGINLITGASEKPAQSSFVNETYTAGTNKVGDRDIVLAKDDSRIGKIKLQRFLSPETKEWKILARFFYTPGQTEILDELNQKTIYYYTESNRLIAVEHYQSTENEAAHLYRKERLFWDADQEVLTNRSLEDENGLIWLCCSFHYNAEGQLIKETLSGNLSGHSTAPLILTEEGYPEQNGVEQYSVYYSYVPGYPHLLASRKEDNGSISLYTYDLKTEHCSSKIVRDHKQILSRYFYFYDTEGFLSRTIVDDGQGEQSTDLTGVTERQMLDIKTCHTGLALGQPLETATKYWEKETGQEVLLEKVESIYSSFGQPLQQHFFDSNGALRYSLQMEYDKNGKLIKTRDSRGEVIETESDTPTVQNKYNEHEQLVATIDKYGNQTDYAYDHLGRLIKTIYPAVLDQHETSILPTNIKSYNIADQVIQSQDANGSMTRTRYNIHGKPAEIHYQDGSSEKMTYYLDGSLKESVARNGIRSCFERDSFGRIVCQSDFSPAEQLLNQTFYTYQGSHLITTDNGTIRTHFSYDGTGRQIASIQETADGIQRVQWKYDETGQTSETKQWFGPGEEDFVIQTKENDQWQNPVQTTLESSDGDIQQTEITEQTDPRESFLFEQEHAFLNDRNQYVLQKELVNGHGVRTLLTYDALGRVERIQTFNSFNVKLREQHFRYDANGNKTREVHEALYEGQATHTYRIEWTYDSSNRVIEIVEGAGSFDQKRIRYEYNQKGQLVSTQKPDGRLLSYEYDEAGCLIRFQADDGSFSYLYQYDSKRRLISIEDKIHNTVTSRTYNSFNQLVAETLGNGLSLKNTYDLACRRTRLTLPDSSSISYQYEGAVLRSVQRLSKENLPLYAHQYEYAIDSGLLLKSSLIKDAGAIDYAYDNKNRLISIKSDWWSANIPESGFDAYQNLTQLDIEDPLGTLSQTYEYSEDNQLIEETGAFKSSHRYDSLYNRVVSENTQWEVNDLNQLIKTDGFAYQYDANGNCIEAKSKKSTVSYQYDALNRLTKIIYPEQTAVSYIYDAFHRRLSKTLFIWDKESKTWKKKESIRFLYDGNKEIGSLDQEERLLELRVLGLGKGAEIGAAVAMEIKDRLYIPIHDFQGSVRCLIDAETRSIAEFYRYSAYGVEKIWSVDQSAIEAKDTLNPWRFSSKRYDTESGLIFYGKRYYNAANGRWLSPDPLFTYDNPNLYTFVQNNPLTHYDMYGLFSISSIWNAVKSAAYSCFTFFKDASHQFRHHLQLELRLPADVHSALEKVGKKLFGEKMFMLLGYHFEETEVGDNGKPEKSDKIRVTLINGILNTRVDLIENLNIISSAHGGIKVHYIFRPTEGWMWDVSKAVMVKLGYSLGFRSSHSRQLAQLWKDMIEEMGGLGGGGVIIHYAHSLGGTETDRARELLTPEEQQMIHVITIGSATMIRNEGFRSVVNYVSVRDGVSRLDVFGRIRNCFDPNTNIKFVGDWTNEFWIPIIGLIIDHPLYVESYMGVVDQLGKQFLIDYCLSD